MKLGAYVGNKISSRLSMVTKQRRMFYKRVPFEKKSIKTINKMLNNIFRRTHSRRKCDIMR